MTEVPSFSKGTVNIGDRQKGRLKAKSVVDCHPNLSSIRDSLRYILSDYFGDLLATCVNPYENHCTVPRVVKLLEEHPLDLIVKKKFYDSSN